MSVRERGDRCPGVLRPWPAADGALARIRVPGGQLDVGALRALLAVAEEYGDGRVRVTGRANVQLRGLPTVDGGLPEDVVTAIETTGLLPSRRHDLARNVLASPQTGLAGGRADLRHLVAELDRRLLADERLAELPGRFLFTLDDGHGDLADRHLDLGLVALDAGRAQLRVGRDWGPVVLLADAADHLADLAHGFLDARGTGPTAAWHVDELDAPLLDGLRRFRGSGLDGRSRYTGGSWSRYTGGSSLTAGTRPPSGLTAGTRPPKDRTSTTGDTAPSVVEVRGAPATSLETTQAAPGADVRSEPLSYGPVPGGGHEPVEQGITGAHVARWAAVTSRVVLTPWHGVLVPLGWPTPTVVEVRGAPSTSLETTTEGPET